MGSDEGKLFVGGISWETDEEKLRDHFSRFGYVAEALVMRDKATMRPRGFGFVAFSDPSVVDAVLRETHVIDGRTIDVKQALARGEQNPSGRITNPAAAKNTGGGIDGSMRTKKIFVGGLPPSLTEEGFCQYFQAYGSVTDAVIMFDQSTQRPRGFGFISFDSEDAVDHVLHKAFHELDGKFVEVKRALPKDGNLSGRSGGGSTFSQSFGSSDNNAGPYDGKADGSRYAQQQATGGGYPGFGYAVQGSAVGYGGYGVTGAYGAPSGSYGNPSTGGYMSGPPSAARTWAGQFPMGYGPTAYGATTWNGPAASGGSYPQAGQLPTGTGYGGQGYGYGGYSGSDGQYAAGGGYGASGGRGSSVGGHTGAASDQGTGSGYSGGGYNDTSGAAAYPNTWRAEPQQGGYAATQ